MSADFNVSIGCSLFLFLLLISCSQPFDFDIVPESVIVVDAKVSTAENGSYVIFFENGESGNEVISDLDIYIVSNQGEKFQFVFNKNTSRYSPLQNDFVADVGMSYHLEATSSDGQIFRSESDQVMTPVDFDVEVVDTTQILSFGTSLVTKEGLAAIAVMNNPQGFLKYDFSYSYRHNYTGQILDVSNPNNYVLFDSREETSLSQARLTISLEDRRIWTFLNPDSSCDLVSAIPCLEPCCLETDRWVVDFKVTQQSLTSEVYQYWYQVKQLISNDGLLFDTFPFPIEGKITCSSCNKKVVGLFRAVSESSKNQLVNL